MSKQTIFSFDMGLGSLGIAVKQNDDIVLAKSLLMDADVGSIKEQSVRRRFSRTRLAHKNREKWLEKIWKANKIDGLLESRKVLPKCDKNGKQLRDENGKIFDVNKADSRLEREFPEKNDNTIYTSSLLRIKLLQNEKLETWQIYKALRSAIQRRGYDQDVPWKATVESIEKKSVKTEEKIDEKGNKKEDKENEHYRKAINAFREELKKITDNVNYHFTCYYDAFKMGLWDPKTNKINLRQTHNAQRARGTYTPPRDLVEYELYKLLQNAAKQIPKLKNQIGNIMYGENGGAGDKFLKLYEEFLSNGKTQASYELKKSRYPFELKHEGLLAQKYPRFDNRIVSKCCLIPRLNVCRADDELVMQVTFLMKLKNLLLRNDEGEIIKLTPEDINIIYKEALEGKFKTKKNKNESVDAPKNSIDKVQSKLTQINTNSISSAPTPFIDKTMYRLNKSDLKNWLAKNKSGCEVMINNEVVEPPKTEGRSRYCRPALFLMRALILSGKSPSDHRGNNKDDFHTIIYDFLKNGKKDESLFNKVKGFEHYNVVCKDFYEKLGKYDLNENDLDFILKMPDDWYKINVVPQSIAEKYLKQEEEEKSKKTKFQLAQEGVGKIISSCHDPIVRHRLDFFYKKFQELCKDFGEPERVIMEFVREDFVGEEKKKELSKMQNERAKENQEAQTKIKELNIAGGQNALRFQLIKKQLNLCPYTGGELTESKINEYDIDHIYPRSKGGPDAIWNKVLVTRKVNSDKGDKPLWHFINSEYRKAFITRIEKMNLDKKTKAILFAQNEDEIKDLLDKYFGLAMTGWTARLARDIVCVRMGWELGAKDEKQKFHVISGGLTGRIRRRFDLNKLLGNGGNEDDNFKDRSDKRHHALDAMVLSYLSTWFRDEKNVDYFRFPKEIEKVEKPVKNPEKKLTQKEWQKWRSEINENVKTYFKKHLDKVHPEKVIKSKVALNDSIYAGIKRPLVKGEKEHEVIAVLRKPLVDILEIDKSKENNWKTQIGKQIESIIDLAIKNLLKEIVNNSATLLEFNEKVKTLTQNSNGGSNVKKIRVKAGSLNDKKNLSKERLYNNKGSYFETKTITGKGTRQHGYYIAIKNGIPELKPVRAFDSPKFIKNILKNNGYTLYKDKLFSAGIQFEVLKDIKLNSKEVSKDNYTLQAFTGKMIFISSNKGIILNNINFKLLIDPNIKFL